MRAIIEQRVAEPMLDRIAMLPLLDRWAKRTIVVSIDTVLCVAAVWIAFSLRLGQWNLVSVPIAIVAAAALIFWFALAYCLGIYRAIFRAVGSGTMINLANAVAGMAIPMIAIFAVFAVPGVPRTIAVMQPIMFFLLLALSRIVARYLLVDLLNQRRFEGERRRTLIYGCGAAGQQLASSLRLEPGMELCGFVDDDRSLDGNRIGRVTISHSRHLGSLIMHHRITDVLLALPELSHARRKRIIEDLQEFPVHVRTLPAMREIVDGRVSVSHLRDVEVEDLLGRDPVAPNPSLLGRTIGKKIVMVTGAGGSIGSELCRQIVQLGPTDLILVENSEFALYKIEQEVRRAVTDGRGEPVRISPELANVADADSILRVMEHWRPHTVFHAAAYKHVPLIEANIVSGARNNVLGTLYAASAAERVGVRNFVLVSTDKAVRPTNVMGATKRVCELILQALAADGSRTIFSMVRFGNVLGSSGSVVPLFKRQIREGGPLTVTDKRMTRFFMTIPEASQLVIQSAGMAQGGEVYLLDMGQPVKIVDFAKTMVRLSGMTVRDEHNPDGDIEIVEIGLRPGEKMYEEMLIGNNAKPTSHSRIMQARERYLPLPQLMELVEQLKHALSHGDSTTVLLLLTYLVPEYQPSRAELEGQPGKNMSGKVAVLPLSSRRYTTASG